MSVFVGVYCSGFLLINNNPAKRHCWFFCLKMPELSDDKIINKSGEKKQMEFEAKQNAIGFFSVLLKVAKRNPELWKQICNENNENNRDTNNTD